MNPMVTGNWANQKAKPGWSMRNEFSDMRQILPVCPSSLQISSPETALNILTLSSSEPVTIIS